MSQVTVTIGGVELVVRPLTVSLLKAISEKQGELDERGGGPFETPENIDATMEIIRLSLSRGNPTLTREWLEAELELPDVGVVLAAIQKASGLTSAKPGEAASP